MIESSFEDQILTLTLAGPSAVNALNEQNYDGLHHALLAARDDERVRAVVLAASGHKAFCAGADLKEYADRDHDEAERLQMHFLLRALTDLVEFPKPVVAAVHAPAIGAGMMLACACDEIVMADSSWMSLPEAQINIPTPIAAVVVGRWVRQSFMHVLLQRAERMGAESCLAHGLVQVLAPADAVLQAARDRLSIYLTMQPHVYAVNKRWLNRGVRDQLVLASQAVHG